MSTALAVSTAPPRADSTLQESAARAIRQAAAAARAWFESHPVAGAAVGLAALAAVAWLSLLVVRRIALPLVGRLARRDGGAWHAVLFDREVFHRLSWMVPALVVAYGIGWLPGLPAASVELVGHIASASLIVFAVRTFAALLAAVNQLYRRHPRARERPITGWLQVTSVAAHLAAGVWIVALFANKDPLLVLSGLGAAAAVLVLTFRETVLSLVAGVQITANDLIRVGDWIEMPEFGADGDVIDIALDSVRVQNWDKTITVIPTHKFLQHSFKNWRGMQEAGGRRIKRAIQIDIGSVRFLTDDEIERFGHFVLLREYMARKKSEIAEYNRTHCPDPSFVANARRLSNVGTLRAYIVQYLRQHPRLRQDMDLVVRQLEPGPEGLPIEIYAFAGDTRLADYESVQADIFDHVLAIVPEFGLRVYQNPSGHDLALAAAALTARERPLQPA